MSVQTLRVKRGCTLPLIFRMKEVYALVMLVSLLPLLMRRLKNKEELA